MAPVIVVAVVEVFVVVVVTKKCNPDEQKCKVEILYILKLFSLLIYIRNSNHFNSTSHVTFSYCKLQKVSVLL